MMKNRRSMNMSLQACLLKYTKLYYEAEKGERDILACMVEMWGLCNDIKKRTKKVRSKV